MADTEDFTITGNTIFPVGTTVSVFTYEQIGRNEPDGPPPSSGAVQTQTMGAGSVTFTALEDGRYWAVGQVAGAYRWMPFMIDIQPSFLGPKGDTGDTGPQGLPGTSGLGVDVWNSQASPGAVTDWGPIINTLISGGARRLLFGEHDFPFSTIIDLEGIKSAVLEGATGAGWTDSTDPSTGDVAKLLWKGTGSGTSIKLGHSNGVTFRDLFITYDSSSYTGDLVDLGSSTGDPPSSFTLFENCRLASSGSPRLRTARSIIKTAGGQGSVYPVFRGCGIAGAKALIRGWETGSSTPAFDMTIEDCMFGSWTDAALMNVGVNWRLKDITFEFTTTASVLGIGNDITYTGNMETIFWATNCTFWDSSDAAQKAVSLTSSPSTAIFQGGWCGSFTGISMEFLNEGKVTIEDMTFATNVVGDRPVIDLGTSAATQSKDLVRIVGSGISGADNTGMKGIKNLDGGHKEIQVHSLNPSHGAAAGAGRQVRTITGQERLGLNNEASERPAFATHAGQTNIGVCQLFGTDTAGVIFIRTSGGASQAGSVLDITFGFAMLAGYGGSFAGGARTPLVHLSPIHDGGQSALAADYYAAQPYAKVTSSLTGFEVGVVNAIPNSKVLGIAYRVIQL